MKFTLGLFALFEILKNFCTWNELNIYSEVNSLGTQDTVSPDLQ